MSNTDEEECPICMFLQECEVPDAIEEMLQFTSNRTSATLLSMLSGSKITMTAVKKHKKQTKKQEFYDKIKNLDLSTTEGMNRFYVIDGIHHAILDPGTTGSIAGLTAVKNLQDLEEKRKERGDFSVQLVDRLSEYLQKQDKITPVGVLQALKKIVSELSQS